MKSKTSKSKKVTKTTSKVDEFMGYAIGISLIFVTGAVLMISYGILLQAKHGMGK